MKKAVSMFLAAALAVAHSQDVDHPQIQEAQVAQHQRRAVPQTAQQMEAYLRSVVSDLQQVQQQFMVPQL